jgi:hypothetical protein
MLIAFATDSAPHFGPHNIISLGEVLATLIVLAIALIAFTWMARHVHH